MTSPGNSTYPINLDGVKRARARISLAYLSLSGNWSAEDHQIIRSANKLYDKAQGTMALNWQEVFGNSNQATDSKLNYFGYRDAANKMQLLINTPPLFELGTQDAGPPSDLSAEQVAAMGADSDDESDDNFPTMDLETLRLHEFLEQGKTPPSAGDRWFPDAGKHNIAFHAATFERDVKHAQYRIWNSLTVPLHVS
ncbi:hypothetical protein K435DRAFT_802278 [Dendrothele bispora CBS 962.96]|uniref:Uncharacterized protein n=1 Tax=Dendrothele bispora (strain CBS 962.96) TaxID=1314807 RepID=A0A4S8LLE2_DENBC|nr:hypothetical protein K435DRAFT_802278 [Dendrothele bispora CBS 962.96]